MHAITPTAGKAEMTKLLVMSRLIGFEIGTVDWNHVNDLMTTWRIGL